MFKKGQLVYFGRMPEDVKSNRSLCRVVQNPKDLELYEVYELEIICTKHLELIIPPVYPGMFRLFGYYLSDIQIGRFKSRDGNKFLANKCYIAALDGTRP